MVLFPGAKPFEPFRKGSKAHEGGNTGRRTIRSCRAASDPNVDPRTARSRPFSSRPESSGGRPYREFRRKGKLCRPLAAGRGARPLRPRVGGRRDPLQQIGELDGELDPFADLVGALGRWPGGALQLAELAQQELEVLGQELLAEMPDRGAPARDRESVTNADACMPNRVVGPGPPVVCLRAAQLRSQRLYARQGCRPVRNQGFRLVTTAGMKPVAGRRALRQALARGVCGGRQGERGR